LQEIYFSKFLHNNIIEICSQKTNYYIFLWKKTYFSNKFDFSYRIYRYPICWIKLSKQI
jgi:hypothetical protein